MHRYKAAVAAGWRVGQPWPRGSQRRQVYAISGQQWEALKETEQKVSFVRQQLQGAPLVAWISEADL